MPVAEEIKSSWADEVEEVVVDLPGPTTVYDNGFKVVTEYRRNEQNQKEKIIRTYKIVKRYVSKGIAERRTWRKFGAAASDPPGPNPANTIVAEEVFMQFLSSKEDQDKPEEDVLDKLKSMADKTVKCRTCNGDHWTLKCPYKDTGYVQNKAALPAAAEDKRPGGVPATDEKGKTKYVAPGLREGSTKRGETMGRRYDDSSTAAIRISNLSESTQESDLEDLVKPFGDYNKLFLAKDKSTGLCKGFAYIHFKSRAAAATAIAALNGHGYDHLILTVDWSKPQQTSN